MRLQRGATRSRVGVYVGHDPSFAFVARGSAHSRGRPDDDKVVNHLRLARFGRDDGFTLSEITRLIEDIAQGRRRRDEVLADKLKELRARRRSIDPICGLWRAKIRRLEKAGPEARARRCRRTGVEGGRLLVKRGSSLGRRGRH